MSLATRKYTRTHRAASKGSRRARWLALLTAAALVWPALQPPASADPASPITVTNVASPSPVASGAEITYTITMTNTGGAKLTNLVMTDQLNGVGTLQSPPATPQYAITSTQGTCTQSGQLVSCSGGTLNGGASWTVTIRGVVTAPSGSTLNNTAGVTGTKSAQNFTTNASNQTLVQGGSGTPLPDLTINKTGPSSVVAGSEFDYLLTVNNVGAALANDIKVTDTLPAGVTLRPITATNPSPYTVTSLFTCTSAGSPVTVTCTGGRVNGGQNGSIRLHVVAPATIPAAPLTNTAAVDPDNAIAEGNELNNTSALVNTAVTAAPQQGSISIIKTDDPGVLLGAGPDPVFPGQTLTYKVQVKNDATTRADDVVVVDGTQGLEASSIVATQVVVNGTVGNGNGCAVNAPEVRCSIRSLNAGGTLTITIRGLVVAPAGTTLINTATATANIRNTGVRATATERTTVKPQNDLTITKAGQPDPVCARSWPSSSAGDLCTGGLKYTFVVGNSGVSTTPQVVVRDAIPAGVIYDSYENAAGSDFTCTLGTGNVLTCTNPSISAESTEAFSIIVVPPSGTGTLTNSVVVDPNNAIFEADETNNNASATVQVTTGVDLSVFKYDEPSDPGDPIADPAGTIPAYPAPSGGFDPIATNGTQTYTIYVDNLGTQDATGVRVEDTLPAGTRFLSASGTQGFTCSHDGSATGGKVTCVGGHLDGTYKEFYPKYPGGPTGNQFATITIKLFATDFVQQAMHNEVRVDPLDSISELDESNNLDVQDTVVKTTGDGGGGAFVQLKIDKSATAEVGTSSVITYTLDARNVGTDPAVNVTVRDVLPAGTQFISAEETSLAGPATRFSCSESGGTVTCSGATLSGTVTTASGAPTSRTITIKAFSPTRPGNVTNTAVVDPSNAIAEGDETDNQDSATTKVVVGAGFIDLRVKKCDGPITLTCAGDVEGYSSGDEITYNIEVSNAGTDPAFQVVVRDALPAGLTFVSAQDITGGDGSFLCGESGGVVTCTGGTIDGSEDLIPGMPTVRTIQIVVQAPQVRQKTYTNQVSVDPFNAIAESNETNNTASDTLTVSSPYDLTIDKDGPTTAQQNNTEDYVITVTNEKAAVDDVVVRDPLPVGLIPLGVEATGNFTCEISPTNVVECVGDMAGNGATATITVHVFITQDGGTLDNEACVDPDNTIVEEFENDNCKTKTTVIRPFSPNISVQKSASSGTVSIGATLEYTISVSNTGDAKSAQFDLTDVLPSDVKITGDPVATNGLATCTHDGSAAGGTVTCDVTDGLSPGQSTVITIQTEVLGTASGALTNTARANDGNAVAFDPVAPCDVADACVNETPANEANNTDSVTTNMGGAAIDLAVGDVTDVLDPSATSDLVTYTATVTNAGTQDADDAVITVNLPSEGVTNVSVLGSQGFSCVLTNSDALATCTGDLIAGQSTSITARLVVEADAPNKLTVTVTADPLDVITETDETNNTQTETTTITHEQCTGCVDLQLGQILASPNPIPDDTDVTYQFTVTNVGDQAAVPTGSNRIVVAIDLDRLPNESTFVSANATNGFTCGLNPLFGPVAPASPANPEILCTGPDTGLAAADGTTVTVVAHADTSPPSYVDFDVVVTSGGVAEFQTNNNDGGLRVDTYAP